MDVRDVYRAHEPVAKVPIVIIVLLEMVLQGHKSPVRTSGTLSSVTLLDGLSLL